MAEECGPKAGDQRTGPMEYEIAGRDHRKFCIRQAISSDKAEMSEVFMLSQIESDGSDDDFRDKLPSEASTFSPDQVAEANMLIDTYLVLEPQFAFLLIDNLTGRVVGYVLGCSETEKFENRLEKAYLPKMRLEHPEEPQYNYDVSSNCPRVVRDKYPSHIHIDMHPRYCRLGLGAQLLQHLLRVLQQSGSPGVHVETLSDNAPAASFYLNQGLSF